MTHLSCDMVRDLFFELRHGRIEKPQREAFDEHIKECTACHEHVEKLDSMLDEAMLWQPEDALAVDRKSLFDAILNRVENPDEEVASLIEDDDEAPLPLPEKRSLPWMRGLLIAAAIVIAAMAWPLFFAEFFAHDSSPAPSSELVATGDGDESAAPSAETAGQINVSDDLRVLPSEHARWSLQAIEEGWEIDATGGTLIVEFLPRERRNLTIRFPGGQGRVTGTVLYVDAELHEFGVIVGQVEIDSPQGQTAVLDSRQTWRNGAVTALDEDRWQEIDALIDLERHEIRLEELGRLTASTTVTPPQIPEEEEPPLPETQPELARHDAPPSANQQEPPRTTEQRPSGPLRLRLEAERAMRDRNFQAAATHYEALLEILPRDDRSAGSIRLDLARLYQRHLNEPARTVDHLRHFVETWPDDTVTPQAIAELCRLVDDPDLEPHCRRP